MLRKALRQGTLSGKLTPVHCGSSKEYHGVRLLLDAVRRLSAVARRSAAGRGLRAQDQGKERASASPNPSEPFCGLAFKTVSEKHGDLVFLRIYSGELQPGDTVTEHDRRTRPSASATFIG